MQKITPFLWFDDQAEEAVKFYASIFKNSKIKNVSRYSKEAAEASGRPEGSVMVIVFELDEQEFMAINGGPSFKFTEAVSFMVNCKNQNEVDRFWERLSEGGEPGQCGWLKDKYGLSWQIVPTFLVKIMADKEQEKVRRVMAAMLKMNKIEIDVLKKSYDGG